MRLLNFSPAHALVLDHDEFQRAQIAYLPNWVERLEVQSALGPAFSVLQEGRVLAIFGACEILPGVAEMWLMKSESNDKKHRLLRAAKSFVACSAAAMSLKRVQCSVECVNFGAIRFAHWLHFEVEGRMRSHGHADHFLMARIFE